jgi:hypothetical protein
LGYVFLNGLLSNGETIHFPVRFGVFVGKFGASIDHCRVLMGHFTEKVSGSMFCNTHIDNEVRNVLKKGLIGCCNKEKGDYLCSR